MKTCKECICNSCFNKIFCNDLMGDEDFCETAKAEGVKACFDTSCTGYIEEVKR